MRRIVMVIVLGVGAAACLGEMAHHTPRPEPSAPSGTPPQDRELTMLGSSSVMASDAPDGGATASDMLSLPKSDLTGLTDCFGASVCDPANMICIKYLNGSTGNPGAPRMAPSCFAPADPCPNGLLDCACIAADPSLAMNCGVCIDNGNNTFTCYAS